MLVASRGLWCVTTRLAATGSGCVVLCSSSSETEIWREKRVGPSPCDPNLFRSWQALLTGPQTPWMWLCHVVTHSSYLCPWTRGFISLDFLLAGYRYSYVPSANGGPRPMAIFELLDYIVNEVCCVPLNTPCTDYHYYYIYTSPFSFSEFSDYLHLGVII